MNNTEEIIIPNTKETIKKIFKNYIEANSKLSLVLTIIFGIIIASFQSLEPLFFAQIIKKLEDFYKTSNFDINSLFQIIIFWVIFIITSLLVDFIYRYKSISKNTTNLFIYLASKYSKKIVNMSGQDYLSKKTGSLFKIFDRGCDANYQILYFLFSELTKTGTSIIFIIILMLFIDPIMTLITLSMLPVMIAFGIYFYKVLGPKQRIVNDKWDYIFGNIGNIMSNLFLVKTLNLENKFNQKTNETLDDVLKKQMTLEKLWRISEIYTGVIVMISRMLVLGFGIFFVIRGTLTLANLILFFSYLGRVYFPLGFIFGRLQTIQEQMVGAEKFYKEFDNLSEDSNLGENIDKIKGNIEFKNVYFGYNKDKNVIKNLSFKINKGEKIAIVGHTGAGKSTLINIILKFWEINKGEILIDGKSINEINKESLRRHIGIVSQDNSLFNLSIRENIEFALDEESKIDKKFMKEKIENALKNANAEFVYKLPKGLETVIGERGLKLSGGEKQRISIARLFLKNPEILILDEATSALDNKTEKLIHKSLDKLMEGKTSIIIAHRLTTIKNVDKIFMLEDGKIVETGTYEELIEKKGKFFDLANPDKMMIN